MIFAKSNVFFLICSVIFLCIIAVDSDESSNVLMQLYTGDRPWKNDNYVPLSVIIDIKNNNKGTEAYLVIPMSFKYVKTLDAPKHFTSLQKPNSAATKGKWMCNAVLGSPDALSVANMLLKSGDEVDEDDDDDEEEEEEEDEGCSAEEIITSLKKLSVTQRSRVGIKLKEDLEAPIEEDKLKMFSKDQLVKIDLPKEHGVIKSGKYIWNILLSHASINSDDYESSERLNWYFVIAMEGDAEIPKYINETSLLSYRHLSQALKLQKMKIISDFRINLEKTKTLNADLVPNLPASITTSSKDITIKFKAPAHIYKSNRISLRIFYPKETKLCKKLELTASAGKINIGKCDCSSDCKGAVILSNFDEEWIKDIEYTLIIRDTDVDGGDNVEITMIENDPYDELEKISGIVSGSCKTLFQHSYIKYMPFIISRALLTIPQKSIKAKFYIHQHAYNTSYLYGILDLPKINIKGGYKMIIETEDGSNKSNLQFIDNASSKLVSNPKLPKSHTVDSTKNKLEISILNNDSNKYTSIPLLLKYTTNDIKTNLKLSINSVDDNTNMVGSVEIVNTEFDNAMLQIHGPRFMDKNTIIYTFSNVKKGDYFIQIESTSNLIDKCGELNVSHETIVKTECSDKSLKINLSLPHEQQRIDFKVGIKQYKPTDELKFTLGNGVKNLSYNINLQELFENVELDDAICIFSQKSAISDSTMVSSFQMLKCATPWMPSEYHKHTPNLYLLDDMNKLVRGDRHIFRYNTDPLSNDVLPKLMPMTLYILANTTDIKMTDGLSKVFRCKVTKLKENVEDQIIQIYNENSANGDKEKIAIAIITTNNTIVDHIKKLPKTSEQTKHLFVPLFLINSNAVDHISLQHKSPSPNYLDPKRITPLYQNDPTKATNVVSAKIGDSSLHFGVTHTESIDAAMASVEELMYSTVIPAWTSYLSCVNTSTVNVQYMDKNLFSVTGKYSRKHCDYLTLLSSVI